ncbi:hypothetical protein ACYOEI_27715, partial [Singulisphaera rosea]
MSQIRILNVGQCGFDNSNLTRFFDQHFRARVSNVDTFDEAVASLRAGPFDLVLVNRISDADGSPGLELIGTLKADQALSEVPVMLVSNFANAQADAVALGALPGFGKSDLR